MPRLLTMMVLAGGLLATTATASAEPRPLEPPGSARDAYRTDGRGRTFRVAFPRHDRLMLDAGHELGASSTGVYALSWALSLDVDFPEEEIWWQLHHRAATVELRPRADRPLALELVRGDYLRHDVSSTILIPARRDIRLPAPFDIALSWSLMRAEIATFPDVEVERWEVGQLALMADFVRDPRYLHRLAFGIDARYDAEQVDAAWRHEIVPFSALIAVWSWEHPSGRFGASLRPSFGRRATLSAGAPPAWSWSGRVAGEVEWTPLAVNDAPLSVVARGTLDGTVGAELDWTASLAARVSIPTGH